MKDNDETKKHCLCKTKDRVMADRPFGCKDAHRCVLHGESLNLYRARLCPTRRWR